MHREQYGGTEVRPRSPLVGRSAQLERLEALYARARGGAGSLALLWGEAGIGKTRLLDEFSSRALGEGARVAATTCFEFLCPPFAPLQELTGALGISQPFETQAAPRSEARQYKTFLAAAESLKGAVAGPLVLVIDDLQWADFATLEFLAFLTPRLGDSMVLVLGAVRTEQIERDHLRHEALTRLSRQGALSLPIPPLEGTEMRRLVSALWPADAPNRGRDVGRVCALAEGKPYFAEELVNSAVAERGGPKFDAAPLSIRAGVLARFERLATAQQRTLLYAAVIGRSFDAALLAEVTRSSAGDVAGSLVRARDLQLVREVRESPGLFVFRHAITREILYRELLAFQTRAIHREVAERVEVAGSADSFDLAYHWNAAGDAERGSRAYERAGDAALLRNAHRDAEAAYRAALEPRSSSDAAYPLLCEKLSRALSANGEVDEACAFAERAVNAYVAAGDTLHAATLAIRLARRTYESGKPELATAIAQRALQLTAERGTIAYDAYVTLAHFEALQGKNDAALAYLASAEATPGEHSTTDRRNACMVRALVAATSGRLMQAFEDYEDAVELARQTNDAEQLAWTLNNYASRATATGWTERALAAHSEAERCLRCDEFGKVRASTIQGMAFAELLAGDLAAAREHQQQDAQLPPGIAMTQTARAALGVRLAYYGGDDAEAAGFADPEALELAFSSGETQRIGLLAGCVAALYDATGRHDDARALRSRALEAISTVDFSFWLLDQLAASGNSNERARSRALIAAAAADTGHAAARAYLTLFDARVARLQRKPAAKSLANEAADKFEAIGWPWERAQALEIAGRHAEALELYRRHGFIRHARTLEESRRRARHRTAAGQLTPRELEVARLAAAGESNRSIAARLFISERTVETHIASIFDRFDLTSRRQLGALVQGSAEQVAGEPSP